jgi:hypothetical protein
MRTLLPDHFAAELYDLHQEGDENLFDDINAVTDHLARMRALATLLNASPVPSEWPEVE